ncbi:hypothetical protein TIFTF001_048394 [Ficus carica]|uniref:Uncharacterized protein n=1 Tax=Ficus carica TaxID=3494 RepID=A0AA87ZEQ3_FICCA|nr:hypothetical protein TIFTF001_048394 [Ficus carica]
MMPTEEELKDPCVAQLYLKNPKVVPQLPHKTPVTQPSIDTNPEWPEFQKEIRGQVDSMNKKLKDLKNGQKKSTKLLCIILKLLSNMNDNVEGKPPTMYHVSSKHKMNVQTDDSDALKTDSNDLSSGSQDDVLIDSDIGVVADMCVKAAMEFFNANKVIVCSSHSCCVPLSHEDVEREKEMASVECDKGEKDESNFILTRFTFVIYESLSRRGLRLSRLSQQRSGPMIEVGSPSNASTKLNYTLPSDLLDEPPKEKLEEFME